MMINKFFNKNSEKGRSLIEIIAILVIMAILLIAALIGFRMLLNYLKYKQTAEEVTVVATRYKLKKLQTRRACTDTKCDVRIHDFYPEGKKCSDNSYCVETPDGGQLTMVADGETSTFAVVAQDIQCVSCRAIVELGAFGMFITDKVTNFTTDWPGLTPQEAKDNIDTICAGNTVDNVCTVEPFSLLYGNDCDAGAKYIVNGRCSFCKKGWVRADKKAPNDKSENGCCDLTKYQMECGYCDWHEKRYENCNYCVKEVCMECKVEENNPTDGKNSACPEDKPYCVDGECKPCTPTNGGCAPDQYCSSHLECEDNTCDSCSTKSEANGWVCSDIRTYGLGKDQKCKVQTDRGTTCSDTCATPLSCKDNNNNDCTSNNCTCQCPPTGPTLADGDACDATETMCPGVSCGAGLACVNGFCQSASCTTADGFEPDQEERIASKACSPLCPCNSTTYDDGKKLFACLDGKCQCDSDNKPTEKGQKCFGACGCSSTLLQCKNGGAEVTGMTEGTCQCTSDDADIGESCTGNNADTNCLCSQRTFSNTDSRKVLVCNTTPYNIPGKNKFTCQCNPNLKDKHEIPAGGACVTGENEGDDACGYCANNLPCLNGKCGCQADSDCEQCNGEKCDLTVGSPTYQQCICDSTYFKKEGENCVCKEPGEESYTPWFVKDDGPHICCPNGKLPYSYNGTYICVPVCESDDNQIKQVALFVDYSNSLKAKDPDKKVQGTAKKIIDSLKKFNNEKKKNSLDEIAITVHREDLDGCKQGAAECDATEDNARKINELSGSQKLCACAQEFTKRNGNQQRGGTTFNSAIGGTSDKEHTIAVLISDGTVPDTSFDGKGFVHVIVIDDATDVNWGAFGHYVFENFQAEGFENLIAQEVLSKLCVPPADVNKLTPEMYCSPANK